MTVTQQLVLAALRPGFAFRLSDLVPNVNSNDITKGQVARALRELRRLGKVVYRGKLWTCPETIYKVGSVVVLRRGKQL